MGARTELYHVQVKDVNISILLEQPHLGYFQPSTIDNGLLDCLSTS